MPDEINARFLIPQEAQSAINGWHQPYHRGVFTLERGRASDCHIGQYAQQRMTVRGESVTEAHRRGYRYSTTRNAGSQGYRLSGKRNRAQGVGPRRARSGRMIICPYDLRFVVRQAHRERVGGVGVSVGLLLLGFLAWLARGRIFTSLSAYGRLGTQLFDLLFRVLSTL